MWCDFGANLVQHFIKRYSRYSRYRTKSHDKATISHDISRYSRYQTVFSKLQEIISTFGRNLKKHSAIAECFFYLFENVDINPFRDFRYALLHLICADALDVECSTTVARRYLITNKNENPIYDTIWYLLLIKYMI